MTQDQLKNLLKTGDTRLYGKMSREYADQPVHESFRKDGLAWFIADDEGKVIRPKTWREYLLIIAENETHVLARLCEVDDTDKCFHKTLEESERSAAIAIVAMRNIYSHEGALREREKMCPPVEM